jgi:hypothetical protein
MSIELSDDARRLLRTAGWNEGRTVDVEPVKSLLERRGFALSPVAAEFLGRFHGFKTRSTNRGGLSFIDFDVPYAVGGIEDEDKPFIDALAEAPLTPVGHGGGALLFLTADGEMVVLNDQWLGFSRIPTIAEGMDIILGIRRTPNYDGVPLKPEQIPPGFR